MCRNGDLVQLAPGAPGIVDEVPAGRLYKDGKLLVDAQARTVADRRRLSFAGIVSVALALTDKGELAADPEVELHRHSGERPPTASSMVEIAYDAVLDTVENHAASRAGAIRMRSPKRCAARCAPRSAQHWGKKPMCHVHVLTV